MENLVIFHTLVIASYDKFEEIMTQDLKNHADMGAIDTTNFEIVQKLDAPFAVWIRFITFTHLKRKKYIYILTLFGGF